MWFFKDIITHLAEKRNWFGKVPQYAFSGTESSHADGAKNLYVGNGETLSKNAIAISSAPCYNTPWFICTIKKGYVYETI